jgi:NADH:ubiquinone oxidoreductase subunit 4 (subunit M)
VASCAPCSASLAVARHTIYGALVAMVQPDMKKLVAYIDVQPPRGSWCLGHTARDERRGHAEGAVYPDAGARVSTVAGLFFILVGQLSDDDDQRIAAFAG